MDDYFDDIEIAPIDLADFLGTLERYGYGGKGELPIIGFECKPY